MTISSASASTLKLIGTQWRGRTSPALGGTGAHAATATSHVPASQAAFAEPPGPAERTTSATCAESPAVTMTSPSSSQLQLPGRQPCWAAAAPITPITSRSASG